MNMRNKKFFFVLLFSVDSKRVGATQNCILYANESDVCYVDELNGKFMEVFSFFKLTQRKKKSNFDVQYAFVPCFQTAKNEKMPFSQFSLMPMRGRERERDQFEGKKVPKAIRCNMYA